MRDQAHCQFCCSSQIFIDAPYKTAICWGLLPFWQMPNCRTFRGNRLRLIEQGRLSDLSISPKGKTFLMPDAPASFLNFVSFRQKLKCNPSLLGSRVDSRRPFQQLCIEFLAWVVANLLIVPNDSETVSTTEATFTLRNRTRKVLPFSKSACKRKTRMLHLERETSKAPSADKLWLLRTTIRPTIN
jgi:hypothetical protein